MAELKAIVLDEDEKIKTKVKATMEDPVKQIEQEVIECQKKLEQKQALLKERDFMI